MLDVNDFENKGYSFFNITERVSSLDIFKFQRYFRFISYLYQEKLRTITDKTERQLLTFRSSVLVFPRAQFLDQIDRIFSDREKTNELINLLMLDENRDHVDVLYTPIIAIDDHYVIAPHIVADSNLVRNIIYANNLKLTRAGLSDPMQKEVADALEATGFKVSQEVKLKVNGKELETDIIAWRDGVLFMFECKNSYHPCSTHEMRTSFGHIEKACDQLNVRLKKFRNPVNQKTLFGKLDWNLSPTCEVYTSILIANRVFHGARLDGHPVRQAHEFINVVLRGEIESGEGKRRFWMGTEFQTSDLVSYLKGGSIVADQLSALRPHMDEIHLGPRTLKFLTYWLDADVLTQRMTTNYRASEGPNSSP